MNTQDTVIVIEPVTSNPEATAQDAAGAQVDPQMTPSNFRSSTNTRSMLYRHPSDKMLGGVCGGLAEYSGFDPLLVRALWVIATMVTSGGGFLAYLALWLLLPVGTKNGGQVRAAAIELNERNLGRAAVVLMALGGFWLLSNIGLTGGLMRFAFRFANVLLWPMILIGAGYLLLRSAGKEINFKEIKLNMNFSEMRDRVRSEGSKIGEEMNVKGGFANFRENFPLKRSNSDKVMMGVCGGIGKKLGIDSNLVRLIWAAFSIGSVGTGVLLYVLVGLFLPVEGSMAVNKPVNNDPIDVKIVDGTVTHVM